MYDMYPWDGPGRPAAGAARSAAGAARPAAGAGRPGAPPGSPAGNDAPAARALPAAEGARAVQVALDRRDNGGDAVAGARTPAAGPTRK